MAVFCCVKNVFFKLYLKLFTDSKALILVSIAFHSFIVLAAKVRPPSVSLLHCGHIKFRLEKRVSLL